jgi:hypothetical protein
MGKLAKNGWSVDHCRIAVDRQLLIIIAIDRRFLIIVAVDRGL